MERLTDAQHTQAEHYMQCAAEEAHKAACQRAHCGSVIVKDGLIIGKGFNSPPGHHESQRRCTHDKKSYHTKVTDKTCCIHAEQRAIQDALAHHPDKIVGSTLYFTRINDNKEIEHSGQPYCTICSKTALDNGVATFVLWHAEGMTAYPTEEYNALSYLYTE